MVGGSPDATGAGPGKTAQSVISGGHGGLCGAVGGRVGSRPGSGRCEVTDPRLMVRRIVAACKRSRMRKLACAILGLEDNRNG